jgi:hypothetical protein
MLKIYHKIFIVLKIVVLSLYFIKLIGYLGKFKFNEKLKLNINVFDKNIKKILKIFVGVVSIYLFFPINNNIILTKYDKYFGFSSGVLITLGAFDLKF